MALKGFICGDDIPIKNILKSIPFIHYHPIQYNVSPQRTALQYTQLFNAPFILVFMQRTAKFPIKSVQITLSQMFAD